MGVREEVHCAKYLMLFWWEHLESFIASVCYVMVFVFSNNLTFRADSSPESLPSRCNISERQFPCGPFLPPSPTVGQVQIPRRARWLALPCACLSGPLPVSTGSPRQAAGAENPAGQEASLLFLQDLASYVQRSPSVMCLLS